MTIACFRRPISNNWRIRSGHGIAPPPSHLLLWRRRRADQTFEQVKAALRPEYFTHGYGPTETVVTPMLWKSCQPHCEAAYAPIGRAVGARSL